MKSSSLVIRLKFETFVAYSVFCGYIYEVEYYFHAIVFDKFAFTIELHELFR